jgi:hypothetical protein
MVMQRKFPLGQIRATHKVLKTLSDAHQDARNFLKRHAAGDWGDLPDEVKQANERALLHGGRLRSQYVLANGKVLLIITEADRADTLLLLPTDLPDEMI